MLAAFDLETARWADPVDPKVGLGVCCVATVYDGGKEGNKIVLAWGHQDGGIDKFGWHAYQKDSWSHVEQKLKTHPPASCMSPGAMEIFIRGFIAERATAAPWNRPILVGWNSLSFDWQVLAVESGMYAECKELALNHIDLMFAFLSKQGHRLSLASAAEGIGLKKGVAGLDTGARACDLWQTGEYETVLRYCAQDAIITLELAKAYLAGGFSWRTKSGNEKWFSIKTNSPDDLLVSSVMKWPALSNPLVDPRDSWRWLND